MDPADFKAYIFPLLFFKWISDTWDWERAQAVADFGDDLTEEIEADYHRFVVPADAHWSELRKLSENVGVELQKMLDKLQAANPDKLAGIFGDVAWGNKERLPEEALLNLIDSFDRLKLDPESVPYDMLGNAYEYLLKQFADESGKKAGEFFTPRSVVRLITRILDPQPGESMYDPACGSGGMLVEGINEIREAGHDPHTLRIYGQEVNLTTSAIARMNLYLHGIEDHQIVRGDTLRQPKFRTEKGLARFDVVIANPPFSLKKWGADEWANDPWGRTLWGVPPANSGDYAWIQHMVASMHPVRGRVGVVMPHGFMALDMARARLDDVIAQYHSTGGIDGYPAVQLTHDIPCNAGTDVRIRRRNLETGVYAGASTTAISFNTDYDWSPQGATVTEPSFEGVLAHEIGHTLGLGHSGQTLWSDENQRTTMVASSSPANTDLQETITRDEWAGAANVAGHASNKIPFLTPNPGFERNLSHWAIDGAVSVGSAYARTGSRGVRLSSNSFVWAGSSYDPWVVADGTQSGANHMSTGIVPFTIRADVRHPVTTTGGVQLRWNRRYLNYGPANGKVDGHTTVGAWQGQEFIQPVCDPSGTSWLSCGRGFSRQFNSTTDAWMIRVLALSTSGGYVYIDRFGYFGGTS